MRKALLMAALLPLACSSSAVDRDEERVIGVIAGFNRDDPRVELPDTVARGVAFEVRVTTYGNSCTSKEATETLLDGLHAVVTPYDLERRRGVCLDYLASFEHTATLRFDRQGTGRVVIRGRERPSDELIAVERFVVVR